MDNRIKLLTLSAVFAAMTFALTTFPKIPTGSGYIHMGDSVIYLAACVLPFPYAIFVGAIGGALADVFGGYVIWIVPTLIVKALITLPYNSKSDTILTKRNAFMVLPAGLITVIGYAIAEMLLFGWAGIISGLLMGVIQPIGSAILFLLFAAMLDKIGFKRRIR
ncbi:MAG: TIGR04002 family protein [Oscillospiraceae bacterium]|nr:TIGR04002 family protein [Oscillospiraceae bacterium]